MAVIQVYLGCFPINGGQTLEIDEMTAPEGACIVEISWSAVKKDDNSKIVPVSLVNKRDFSFGSLRSLKTIWHNHSDSNADLYVYFYYTTKL